MALLARRWMGPEVGSADSNRVTKKNAPPASHTSAPEEKTNKKTKKRTKDHSVTGDDHDELPSQKKEKGARVGSSDARTKHQDSQDCVETEATDGPDQRPPDIKDKAKLKRKAAKRRKKRAKARKLQESRRKNPSVVSAYLQAWESRNEGSGWRFNKANQIWLLKHCYDSKQVPKEDFAILLKYLEGLQGAARERTVEEAKAIVLLGGAPINTSVAPESTPKKKKKEKKQKQIEEQAGEAGEQVTDVPVEESDMKDRKLRLRRAKKVAAALDAELEAEDEQ